MTFVQWNIEDLICAYVIFQKTLSPGRLVSMYSLVPDGIWLMVYAYIQVECL